MTMSRGWEDKPHTVRKFLQRIYFRKYCYLTYTKTLEKLNSKKADNSIEKWDKDLKDSSLEKIHRWQKNV